VKNIEIDVGVNIPNVCPLNFEIDVVDIGIEIE
jgi:hypothetical protein